MKTTHFILSLLLPAMLSVGCKEETPSFPEGMEGNIRYRLLIKEPGNPSREIPLTASFGNGTIRFSSESSLPLDISGKYSIPKSGRVQISLQIKALKPVNFHLEQKWVTENSVNTAPDFLLPGFWYRKNLRSSRGAPSFREGHSWCVREDRLSLPLAALYSPSTETGYRIVRTSLPERDALMPNREGEIILFQPTDVGGLGFFYEANETGLIACFPYRETPRSYNRKLLLALPLTAFLHLEAGEHYALSWELQNGFVSDYGTFVDSTWHTAYDMFRPQPLKTEMTREEVLQVLAKYFRESYTEGNDLKGFSGVELHTDRCEKRGILEIGFVGRVLLNAFNALEYGTLNHSDTLVKMAEEIFNSYLYHGFTPGGLLREVVDIKRNTETQIYSIRRQSEGIRALMLYLDFEKKRGNLHPGWETRVKDLLGTLLKLEQTGHSYPRKFTDNLEITDYTGGSSTAFVPSLIMAYRYFSDSLYLNAAERVMSYMEDSIIGPSDYFSSTLDAFCEDKEASLYAATSCYYMALVSEGEKKAHYTRLARKAAAFALSYYYVWDVPFAPGQMLGDLGLKSRGWGNVSVENNHIDAYLFEFADVLNWLAEETDNTRLKEFAGVIRSSMHEQLLPRIERLCGIAKPGFHPEVVHHTNWDYGRNGKGFYNDLFAPGWVVASLWEMHHPGRTSRYFSGM